MSEFDRVCACCGDGFVIEIRVGAQPRYCEPCRYRCFDNSGRRRPGAFMRNLLIARPDRGISRLTTRKGMRLWRIARRAA